jgi:hypothetical protein
VRLDPTDAWELPSRQYTDLDLASLCLSTIEDALYQMKKGEAAERWWMFYDVDTDRPFCLQWCVEAINQLTGTSLSANDIRERAMGQIRTIPKALRKNICGGVVIEGARRGEASPFAKLTDDIVLAIRAEPKAMRHPQIAKKYGISRSYVSRLRSRDYWNHI